MARVRGDADDADLVTAAQAGDSDAFEELFRRHHATVRAVCARRLANRSEADEVAQAAFVRAYERIGQCTAERRFGAWVQVIALRLCADAWRARGRTTPMAEPRAAEERAAGTGADSCEDAVLRTERAAEVRRVVDALPRRQREVVVARHLEGRRPPEVAAALALSVGAVDSLLLRARRRMVASFRAAGVEAGAVSPEAAASVAATSAASSAGVLVRPVSRLVESVAAAVDAVAAGVAATLGVGPAAPSVAQRVAGLVGAGVLAMAPLASGPAGPGPSPAAPTAPVISLPLDRLPAGLTLPAAPGLAVPQLPAPAVPPLGAALPPLAPPPVPAPLAGLSPVPAVDPPAAVPPLDPASAEVAVEAVEGLLSGATGLLTSALGQVAGLASELVDGASSGARPAAGP